MNECLRAGLRRDEELRDDADCGVQRHDNMARMERRRTCQLAASAIVLGGSDACADRIVPPSGCRGPRSRPSSSRTARIGSASLRGSTSAGAHWPSETGVAIELLQQRMRETPRGVFERDRRDGTKVFVSHGRDDAALTDMIASL